ncbi:hypothetical protein [Bradyrhizobium sp. Leo170]|uniref:hypothetical protein n=1 Tax=Bradyrhizobium sp. Leo170 TaxID=1571199 RepID=UPI00102EAAE9|nr:hypothetical protein [Bradyrhizobium sp. Leo170]TAI63412.1 hypothetical protein CWO89_24320 [Bradyrhizobium sp. Leo170]
MTAPDIDLDAEAVHLLAQRRASPRLLIGYLVAVAAVFELMGWQEITDPPAGTRQWRPLGAGSEDVHATVRAASGCAVDLRGGELIERHADAWALFGRLVALAACGHGKLPERTPEAQRLAARALAGSAGVFDESLIEEFQADPEIVAPFFDEIAARVAEFMEKQ